MCKFTNNYVPTKHTEKSVNLPVTMGKAGCKREFDKFSLHSNQKKFLTLCLGRFSQ